MAASGYDRAVRVRGLAKVALILCAGCGGGSGSVLTTVTVDAALAAGADRVRIAVHDRAGFDCTLAYGERPDPILPRVVVALDEENAVLDTVPIGDRVIIVDLLQADGSLVGTGCNDAVRVEENGTVTITLDVLGYPRVATTVPADGDRFVSPSRPLVVVFTERMDASSVADAFALEAMDGSEAPITRPARMVESDTTGRTFSVELPFGMSLTTAHRLTAVQTLRSADGLPLESFEPVTFETDAIVDVERDLSNAIEAAIDGDCSCVGAEGAKGVVKRVLPAGAPVRFVNWPFVVRRAQVLRDQDVLYETTLNDAGIGDCRAEVTADATFSPRDGNTTMCTFTARFTVLPMDCYCAANNCEPPFDTTISEPSCTD